MLREEALQSLGKIVRVRARGGDRHWHSGRLDDVVGEKGVVFLAFHKKTEEIPLDDLRLWKAANSRSRAQKDMSTTVTDDFIAVDDAAAKPHVEEDPWVIVDRSNGTWFQSPHRGFSSVGEGKPKGYDSRTGVNRAIGALKRAKTLASRGLQGHKLDVIRRSEAITIQIPPPIPEVAPVKPNDLKPFIEAKVEAKPPPSPPTRPERGGMTVDVMDVTREELMKPGVVEALGLYLASLKQVQEARQLIEMYESDLWHKKLELVTALKG